MYGTLQLERRRYTVVDSNRMEYKGDSATIHRVVRRVSFLGVIAIIKHSARRADDDQANYCYMCDAAVEYSPGDSPNASSSCCNGPLDSGRGLEENPGQYADKLSLTDGRSGTRGQRHRDPEDGQRS